MTPSQLLHPSQEEPHLLSNPKLLHWGFTRSPLQFFIHPPGVRTSSPRSPDHLFGVSLSDLSFPSMWSSSGSDQNEFYMKMIINPSCVCVSVSVCLLLVCGWSRWHHMGPALWLAAARVWAGRHSESHRAAAASDEDEGVGAAPHPFLGPLCFCWWWVSNLLMNSCIWNLSCTRY